MLHPDEKEELTRLQRQVTNCVQTDNWRDYELIAGRLDYLMQRWMVERHAHGTT
jgi:hypothetical protein